MIYFPELLLCLTTCTPMFWRIVVERLAIKDPPYMSFINTRSLFVHGDEILLDANIIHSLTKAWKLENILEIEYENWKYIKKQSIKNSLLYKYVDSQSLQSMNKSVYLLSLHLGLNHKKITSSDITLGSGSEGFGITSIDFDPQTLVEGDWVEEVEE